MTNFSYLEPNKHLPILVFCIDHKVDIDKYPTMTGHDLDEMANWIDQKYVFEKIVYFDENYKEFSWYPNQTLPENLNLSYFFINQYKCFEVRYRLNPFDIYSSYVFNILRVELNRQIATYLFSFRSRDSPNLIDYYEFRANVSYYLNFDFMHEEFSDQFQVGSIKKSYFFPNLFRKLKKCFPAPVVQVADAAVQADGRRRPDQVRRYQLLYRRTEGRAAPKSERHHDSDAAEQEGF